VTEPDSEGTTRPTIAKLADGSSTDTFVTVTKPHEPRPVCAWCRRPLARTATTGRPKLYCGQPCRQRAYESRRHAGTLGIDPENVLLRKEELERLHDRLYELEAALEDVAMDLQDDHSPKAVKEALDHLCGVASRLSAFVLEPITN